MSEVHGEPGGGQRGTTSEVDDPRAELRALTSAVRGLVELDRLLGVSFTPVPALPPLYRAPPIASAPAALARAPASAPAVASAPTLLASPSTPTFSRAPAAPSPTTGHDPANPGQVAARRAENEPRLEALARRMAGCERCRLAAGRTKLVFGQGDAAAEVAFVGEGPGYHEDQQGLPFVGPAGELLTKMIEALGIARDEAFICNVVKCRPPENRTPQGDEMATCLPFLEEQLAIVRPRVICALGKTAAAGLGLLAPGEALGRHRGQLVDWRGTPAMITYHPAYLLRTPADKRKAWEDLQKLFPFIARRKARRS